MSRAVVALAVTVCVLATAPAAPGQQPGKVYEVGVLCTLWCPVVPLEANLGQGGAFVESLGEFGYIEGRNLLIDHRGSGATYGELARHAAALVRREVDVILALGELGAARVAKQATPKIPIVMAGVGDAVELGLVKSRARPGGNITGVTVPARRVAAKQLRLLKEAVPAVSRVAVLSNPDNPEHGSILVHLRAPAQALGMELHPVSVRNRHDLRRAFSAMRRDRPDALLVLPDPVLVFSFSRAQLALFALEMRMPAVATGRSFPRGAGLMAYGPDPAEVAGRSGAMVGKILDGAQPATLPVEEPTCYELVINLTTAKALGLQLPPSVLGQATEIIR